jgi:hypothetical protein
MPKRRGKGTRRKDFAKCRRPGRKQRKKSVRSVDDNGLTKSNSIKGGQGSAD